MRTYKVQTTDFLVLAIGHDNACVPKGQDEIAVISYASHHLLPSSPTSAINPLLQSITCLRNCTLIFFSAVCYLFNICFFSKSEESRKDQKINLTLKFHLNYEIQLRMFG